MKIVWMSELGDAATAVLGEKKANRVYTALKPTPIRDIEATTRKNNWFISYGCNKKTFSKWKISHLLHHNISVCVHDCLWVRFFFFTCSDKFTAWNYLSASIAMFSGLHWVQLNAFHKISAQYFLISFKFKHIAGKTRQKLFGLIFFNGQILYHFTKENSEQWVCVRYRSCRIFFFSIRKWTTAHEPRIILK